ncbi:MAG: GNAT family N-acetyltransferase [Halanaerobiaceae bacterium]|jgi:GNAT superfamily N-acetyltransferase|nr:GNAT family N-acetyltransferase [Halanaerobiaceae bacterium]
MHIREIHDKEEKREISAGILKALPEWFGIPESVQEYVAGCAELPFFVAMDGSKALGFIVMKENNQCTAEIYVMGVLPGYHGQGIGKKLFNRVYRWAKEEGYEYLQVKTLDESHPDINYAKTRKFYFSVGFRPLECLPELWGKENPCLIMVQHIK